MHEKSFLMILFEFQAIIVSATQNKDYKIFTNQVHFLISLQKNW